MAEGKLIVIDGSDGTGKKTQTELLVQRLKKEGLQVKTFAFPQYDSFFGALISDYLNGKFGDATKIHPKLASLTYALDRFAVKETLQQWLDEGYIVVLDRYAESNMAYQGAKIQDAAAREEFFDWLEDLEFKALGIPKADLVIYLYVPVDIAQELMQKRPGKEYLDGAKKDDHENNTGYLQAVTSTYLKLAREKPNWKLLECVSGNQIMLRQEIHRLVWETVQSALGHAR